MEHDFFYDFETKVLNCVCGWNVRANSFKEAQKLREEHLSSFSGDVMTVCKGRAVKREIERLLIQRMSKRELDKLVEVLRRTPLNSLAEKV